MWSLCFFLANINKIFFFLLLINFLLDWHRYVTNSTCDSIGWSNYKVRYAKWKIITDFANIYLNKNEHDIWFHNFCSSIKYENTKKKNIFFLLNSCSSDYYQNEESSQTIILPSGVKQQNGCSANLSGTIENASTG